MLADFRCALWNNDDGYHNMGERGPLMLADFRCACRCLYRRPAYTLAGTAALGLAVGVALAGLMLVRAVFSRPLPLDEPDRVVSFERHRRGEGVSTGFTYPEFARLERRFADLGAGRIGLLRLFLVEALTLTKASPSATCRWRGAASESRKSASRDARGACPG